MSEYIAETIKHKGLTIKIIADEDATNPRTELDNAGTMVCWHSRYTLGDDENSRRDNPHEFLDSLAEEARPGTMDRLDNKLYSRTVKTSYSSSAAELFNKQV